MDGFFQKYFSKLTIVAREPKLFTNENENEVVTADLHKGKKIHLEFSFGEILAWIGSSHRRQRRRSITTARIARLTTDEDY